MNLIVIKDYKKLKVGQILKDDSSKKFEKLAKILIDNDIATEQEDNETVEKVPPSTHDNPTDILSEERKAQELENYTKNEINWLEGDFWKEWDMVKGHMKKLWGHLEELDIGEKFETIEMFLLAHSKNTIKGKPQLIDNTQKKIPIVREIIQYVKATKDRAAYQVIKYIFLDERYDKRYDGYQRDCLAMDFWLYRVIDNGKEYFILTKQELPNEVCTFHGMTVEMDDFAEFSRSMKVKSLSRLFFMKEFEPAVKIISNEQLVQYTKNKSINEEAWFTLLGHHNKFKNFNRFPKDVELLRSAFLLSSETDGYPLHLFIIGPSGTKKTDGHIETISQKFSQDSIICEGANSRIKALSPSFKEKPANIGYLAKADRVGFIDEIGKMVEFEVTKAHQTVTNVLGELNFLLEHKLRIVGSGNDNDINVQATAKFLFVTNPVSGRTTIYNHVGLIDPTTLSRLLCWVQDQNEQEFVLGADGVKIPPNSKTSIHPLYNNRINRINDMVLYMCSGDYSVLDSVERDDFLTLFDSCNSFLCDVDSAEVERITQNTILLAREPMKSSVWKPRARHHTTLLIDGLVKHRCLFIDYDPSFQPKKVDYEHAERILTRMVASWDTDLSPKEDV